MPEATIVIPLHQRAGQIERALRSVLAQRVADLAVVVVDDGSSDGGGEVVAGLGDPRVRVVRQPNAGVSAARNRGVAESATERVVFLDADDELLPDFLGSVLALAGRHPEAGLWATGFSLDRAPTGEAALPRADLPGGQGGIVDDVFGAMERGLPFVTGCVMTTRRVLDDAGGFVPGESFAEDLDVWARIALRHPVAFVARPLVVVHRDAPDRLSRPPAPPCAETGLMRTLRAARAGADLQHRASLERYLAKHLLKVARNRIRAGDGAGARVLAAEAYALKAHRRDAARLWLRAYWRPWLRALSRRAAPARSPLPSKHG